MANAQFNPAFNQGNFNGPANDSALPQANSHQAYGKNAMPLDMGVENGPQNVPAPQDAQRREFEERTIVITAQVMHMWEDGHEIARGNEQRMAEGLAPLIHQPISRWHWGLLMVLAEERRQELRRQWQELLKVERVLGINKV